MPRLRPGVHAPWLPIRDVVVPAVRDIRLVLADLHEAGVRLRLEHVGGVDALVKQERAWPSPWTGPGLGFIGPGQG